MKNYVKTFESFINSMNEDHFFDNGVYFTATLKLDLDEVKKEFGTDNILDIVTSEIKHLESDHIGLVNKKLKSDDTIEIVIEVDPDYLKSMENNSHKELIDIVKSELEWLSGSGIFITEIKDGKAFERKHNNVLFENYTFDYEDSWMNEVPKEFNRHNFFFYTIGDFKLVTMKDNVEKNMLFSDIWDLLLNTGGELIYKSPIAGVPQDSKYFKSKYLIHNNILYRFSDHWGQVATCTWTLNDSYRQEHWLKGKYMLGMINFEDLKSKLPQKIQFALKNNFYQHAIEKGLLSVDKAKRIILSANLEIPHNIN